MGVRDKGLELTVLGAQCVVGDLKLFAVANDVAGVARAEEQGSIVRKGEEEGRGAAASWPCLQAGRAFDRA